MYQEIKESLRNLYLDDPRPWLVGFSGGKDSTLVAALIFEVLCEIPEHQRVKPISILCTDTRVEIPAIAEMVEGTLGRMQKFSRQNKLNIDINLLSPPSEQSFWVNVVGRGYPLPNRSFRWCTQRSSMPELLIFNPASPCLRVSAQMQDRDDKQVCTSHCYK